MKFSINNPCTEDWDKMKIGLFSRYCEVCTKDVMDFTKMSRQEIVEYLLENQGKKTCGRILPSQLDFTRKDILITLHKIKKRYPNHQIPLAITLVASMMLMGCSRDVQKNNKQDKQTILIEQKDNNINNSKSNIHIEKPKKKDNLIELQGEIALDPKTDQEHNKSKDYVFNFVEEDPIFPGGNNKIGLFVTKLFNQSILSSNEKGEIKIEFIVERDGTISNPKILNGINRKIDNEVIRIIKLLPPFKSPGKNDGKAVRSSLILPIRFE